MGVDASFSRSYTATRSPPRSTDQVEGAVLADTMRGPRDGSVSIWETRHDHDDAEFRS